MYGPQAIDGITLPISDRRSGEDRENLFLSMLTQLSKPVGE